MNIKFKPKQKVFLISIVVAISLVTAGLLTGDAAAVGNLVIISVFIVVIPFFLQKYSKFMWVKAAEEQFPNFVRDLSDLISSGMSFKEAINITSKTNYGKLTEEILKMSNRLSWGTPFLRVIEIFGEKAKNSKMITEALNIIKESYKSGGNVSATLNAVARDMIMFKEIEAERESLVKQHVLIMYGIFFMFVGIAIMIIFVMMPMVKAQGEIPTGTFGMGQFTNPCCVRETSEKICLEPVGAFPCNVFSAIGILFDMPEGITLYYTAMFFMVIIIQGIFTGLIAGQLGENSIVAGSKHSLIMVIAAIAIFLFLTKINIFPV